LRAETKTGSTCQSMAGLLLQCADPWYGREVLAPAQYRFADLGVRTSDLLGRMWNRMLLAGSRHLSNPSRLYCHIAV
jgi:hypothetical protein